MTRFGVGLDGEEVVDAPAALESLLADGLVEIAGDTLLVRPEGRPFLRNAASFFDEYLPRTSRTGPTYSSAV
jgi:hypothetical protein